METSSDLSSIMAPSHFAVRVTRSLIFCFKSTGGLASLSLRLVMALQSHESRFNSSRVPLNAHVMCSSLALYFVGPISARLLFGLPQSIKLHVKAHAGCRHHSLARCERPMECDMRQDNTQQLRGEKWIAYPASITVVACWFCRWWLSFLLSNAKNRDKKVFYVQSTAQASTCIHAREISTIVRRISELSEWTFIIVLHGWSTMPLLLCLAFMDELLKRHKMAPAENAYIDNSGQHSGGDDSIIDTSKSRFLFSTTSSSLLDKNNAICGVILNQQKNESGRVGGWFVINCKKIPLLSHAYGARIVMPSSHTALWGRAMTRLQIPCQQRPYLVVGGSLLVFLLRSGISKFSVCYQDLYVAFFRVYASQHGGEPEVLCWNL